MSILTFHRKYMARCSVAFKVALFPVSVLIVGEDANLQGKGAFRAGCYMVLWTGINTRVVFRISRAYCLYLVLSQA